jgi:hypothetical protein
MPIPAAIPIALKNIADFIVLDIATIANDIHQSLYPYTRKSLPIKNHHYNNNNPAYPTERENGEY